MQYGGTYWCLLMFVALLSRFAGVGGGDVVVVMVVRLVLLVAVLVSLVVMAVVVLLVGVVVVMVVVMLVVMLVVLLFVCHTREQLHLDQFQTACFPARRRA